MNNLMKFTLHVLILFLCARVVAQESDTLPRRRFDIGMVISPDLSYRVLGASGANSWLKESLDTLEVARAAFTAGAEVVVYPSHRLGLRSGLLFGDRGERSRRYDMPVAFGYVNHYYSLSLPLRISYLLFERKIRLQVAAGMSADVLLGSRSVVRYGSETTPYPLAVSGNPRRIGLSLSCGVGLEAPLAERWYFRLEPIFNFSVSSATTGPLRKHSYNGGLRLGLFHHL